MPLFRRRDKQQVDLNERSPQLGLKYKDLLVLEQLSKAGANLREPRHVLYFLYCRSRDASEAIAIVATAAGYEVRVDEPLEEYPDNWSICCERHGVVVDPDTVRDATDFFEALAHEHGGEFDGWEASV